MSLLSVVTFVNSKNWGSRPGVVARTVNPGAREAEAGALAHHRVVASVVKQPLQLLLNLSV